MQVKELNIAQMAKFCADNIHYLTEIDEKKTIGNILINAQLTPFVKECTDGLRINLDDLIKDYPDTIRHIYFLIVNKRNKYLNKQAV